VAVYTWTNFWCYLCRICSQRSLTLLW